MNMQLVPDDIDFINYRQGDIGQPFKGVTNDKRWLVACPICGMATSYPVDRIEKHEDGTVSTKEPLHCHGRNMMQRYSIEKNEVKLLDE